MQMHRHIVPSASAQNIKKQGQTHPCHVLILTKVHTRLLELMTPKELHISIYVQLVLPWVERLFLKQNMNVEAKSRKILQKNEKFRVWTD